MSKKFPPTFMFIFRNPVDMPDYPAAEMEERFGRWMKWIRAMEAKGQYLAGEPLEDKPAKVMRGRRGQNISDGPFVETKEIVAGYMLIAAKNLTAAQKIARDCPGYEVGCSVEIRQVMPL